MAIDIHWIRDNDSLGQHCAEWQQLPFVALDTEFMRVDTFYPQAGLIHVGDGRDAWLLASTQAADQAFWLREWALRCCKVASLPSVLSTRAARRLRWPPARPRPVRTNCQRRRT